MERVSAQRNICHIQSHGKNLSGIAKFFKAMEVYRQRQKLLKMTMDEMRDIGVSHGDLLAEARRGFWDIDC